MNIVIIIQGILYQVTRQRYHGLGLKNWVFYPLPEKTWNTLVSSEDGNHQPIVVYHGKWLGTRINGFFHNSGYDLESLSNGWHHLTVVESSSEGKATTTFYINGKEVAEVGEAQSFTALEFDGTDDYVKVDAHTNPTAAITVSLWAKSNTENWNSDGCLASKRDAYLLHPNANSKTISFRVYASSSWNMVDYTPSDIKQWHHYAGTFDGTTLKLYVDGIEVNQTDAFDTTTPISSDSGTLCIGKDVDHSKFFNGQIAEVCVWDKARTQEQIKADIGKVLEGDESGLVGYWRFKATSAENLSSSEKNGTFGGNPKLVSLSAKTASNIKFIGNTQAGEEQFGKLAEVRAWNLALKEAEIVVNSKTRLSGNEPGLAAYYPLNEATGTEVRDVYSVWCYLVGLCCAYW